MIASLLLLFLFLVCTTGIIFFFFCLFLPAIKMRYEGIHELLSTETNARPDDEYIPSGTRGRRAVVGGDSKEFAERRMVYTGERDCALFNSVYRTEYLDAVCCIGFGDCQKKCPQNAITVQGGVAVVNDLCNGCGACLAVCPLDLISLVPVRADDVHGGSYMETRGYRFFSLCRRILGVIR